MFYTRVVEEKTSEKNKTKQTFALATWLLEKE